MLTINEDKNEDKNETIGRKPDKKILYEQILILNLDTLFTQIKDGQLFTAVNVHSFGPDFTNIAVKQALIDLIEYFRNKNLIGITSDLYKLKSRITNYPISDDDAQTIRLMAKNGGQIGYLMKGFLNNPDLSRSSVKSLELFVDKADWTDNTLEFQLVTHDRDVSSFIVLDLSRNLKSLSIKQFYPKLSRSGLGGFGENFMITLFKSILNSKDFDNIVILNPLNKYWDRFGKRKVLDKSEILMWLKVNGYISNQVG